MQPPLPRTGSPQVTQSLWGLHCLTLQMTGTKYQHIQYTDIAGINKPLKSSGRPLQNKKQAFLSLAKRAAANVYSSVMNIFKLGQISVNNRMVKNSILGRAKAVGCSFLSLLTLPINLFVDATGVLTKAKKISLLSEHMWKGFVTARTKKSIDKSIDLEEKSK